MKLDNTAYQNAVALAERIIDCTAAEFPDLLEHRDFPSLQYLAQAFYEGHVERVRDERMAPVNP